MSTLRVLSNLAASAARVVPRRISRGPLRPGWPLGFEIVADSLRRTSRRIAALPPAVQGAAWEEAAVPAGVMKKVRVDAVSAGGVPAEWIVPLADGEGAPVVLHLHGGWFSSCSPRNFREPLARIVTATGRLRVLSVDYRLAPQHPFPAQIEDALAAWRWLLASERPSRVVVVGESAGGGLTAALMLRLRDEGLPMPAGAALLSPWVDLSARGGSLESNADCDWFDPEEIPARARLYLGDRDPTSPLASPLLADLRGLPPLLVQVGDAEMLRDQGVRFAEKARAAGVPVTLDLLPDMIHNAHVLAPVSPVARAAIERIAAFIRERTR